MKKFLKRTALVLAILFLAIQTVRPAKTNPAAPRERSIHAQVEVPGRVAAILERSCRDCHSGETRWPWYSNVAPVSWFLVDHVNHARSHMNFSDWAGYDSPQAQALLENMCKLVSQGEMPLDSYLLMHRKAKLSPQDVRTLCEWSAAERQKLANK